MDQSSIKRKPVSSHQYPLPLASHDAARDAHVGLLVGHESSSVEGGLSQKEQGESVIKISSNDTKPKTSASLWVLWWGEILCALLSILLLLAIVILLKLHQDQPTSRWTIRISLNAVIAILSAGLRASLLLPITEGR
jgi:hypothetical protein